MTSAHTNFTPSAARQGRVVASQVSKLTKSKDLKKACPHRVWSLTAAD